MSVIVKNIKKLQLILNKLKKQQYILVFLRLFTFILFILFLYKYFSESNNLIHITIAILLLIAYLIVNRYDNRLKEKILLTKTLLNINLFELKFTKGESEMAETGAEYIDSNHLFTYDLDIFGDNSLFQNINRTTTFEGRNKLAFWLSNPLKSEREIKKRQEAISELKGLLEWRQLFSAYGQQQNLENKEYPSNALNQHSFKANSILRVFAYLSPLSLLVLFALAYLNIITYLFPLALIITNYVVCAFLNYKINKSENRLNLLSKQIYCYYNIATHIKSKQFISCN